VTYASEGSKQWLIPAAALWEAAAEAARAAAAGATLRVALVVVVVAAAAFRTRGLGGLGVIEEVVAGKAKPAVLEAEAAGETGV
jgi:hypothetical protein